MRQTYPSSIVGQRALALSVTTGGGLGMVAGGVQNSETQTLIAPHDAWGPAHSLYAKNNEAAIPVVAMTSLKKKKGATGWIPIICWPHTRLFNEPHD